MAEFPIIQKKLPSGLRVVLLPRSERPTVTFLVLVGVGSRYETEKQWGLSHFLEHMFFKGTTTRPTTKEIAELIDGVGGEFNAFTGEEYTGYYVKLATEHLKRGADVVSDILLRPLFAEEEIEREKGVITEEIRMYTSMPMAHVRHLWHEALFGKHPLGRRIDGLEKTVHKLTRKDFVDYTTKHYHTENTVVTVAGGFEPKHTMALLEKLFADLPRGKASSPKAAPTKLPHQKFVHEHRAKLEQTQFIVGVPGVSLGDERRFTAGVLAGVLGGGMSSRMFIEVRERHGLAYAVKTSSEEFIDTGSLATQVGAKNEKAELALHLIVQEYDRIMHELVSSAELKKAQEMMIGHLLLELEETNSLAVFAGAQELLEEAIMTPEDIKERVRAVTAQEVQAIARELLDTKKRAVALLGPQKDVSSFKKLVLS